MICAPAADWCEAIAAGFQKDTGIKVAMVRKSAGEILAQVRAEKENPKLDIWFGASTDTPFVFPKFRRATAANLTPPLLGVHDSV